VAGGVVVGVDGGYNADKAEGLKAVAQGGPGARGRCPGAVGLGQTSYDLDVCAGFERLGRYPAGLDVQVLQAAVAGELAVSWRVTAQTPKPRCRQWSTM